VYGQAYVESIPLLAILIGMPLVGFYNVAMSQALNAARHHAIVARVAAVAALVSVTLNLALVGSVGVIAAAAITVVTELVTAVAFTLALRPVAGLAPLRAYLSAVDAVLVMSAAVVALRAFDAPLGVTIAFAAVAYAVIVFVRKPDSLRSVLRLLGR
jgi:O-antigen/teichoic acid export membrane protein